MDLNLGGPRGTPNSTHISLDIPVSLRIALIRVSGSLCYSNNRGKKGMMCSISLRDIKLLEGMFLI